MISTGNNTVESYKTIGKYTKELQKRTGIDPIETCIDTGSFRTKSELKTGPKHSGLWQTLSGSGA